MKKETEWVSAGDISRYVVMWAEGLCNDREGEKEEMKSSPGRRCWRLAVERTWLA